MTKRLSLRERILALLAGSPETEFRPMQIAAAMCCPETEVSVRLSKDLKAGRICKRRDGRAVWYRIGDVNATAPEQPEVAKPEPQTPIVLTVASAERFIPSESTATGWQPPKMVPPRVSSAPEATTQRGTWNPQAVLAKLDILHPIEPAEPAVPPAPADEERDGGALVPGPVAIAAEPVFIAAAEEPEPEPEEEEAAGDAYVNVRTGELVIVGLPPDDEGRVTVPPDLVSAIRRQIAWMAA